MHSPSPIVVTVRWFAVLVNGSTRMRRRMSAGSSPSCSAALSSCTSRAKRGCGVPCPRLGPHGGLLVNTRALELVHPPLVGDRVDHAGVERRGHAVRAVHAAP